MEIIRLLKIRYAQSLRWNNRNKKSSYFSVLKKRIRSCLISLSGNDLPSMLLDILEKDDLAIIHSKYINALKNKSKMIVKQKNQHYFIRSIRQAGLSLDEAKELGFQCGKYLWRTCLDQNERNIGWSPRFSMSYCKIKSTNTWTQFLTMLQTELSKKLITLKEAALKFIKRKK